MNKEITLQNPWTGNSMPWLTDANRYSEDLNVGALFPAKQLTGKCPAGVKTQGQRCSLFLPALHSGNKHLCFLKWKYILKTSRQIVFALHTFKCLAFFWTLTVKCVSLLGWGEMLLTGARGFPLSPWRFQETQARRLAQSTLPSRLLPQGHLFGEALQSFHVMLCILHCHLVHSENTVGQINTQFSCRSG